MLISYDDELLNSLVDILLGLLPTNTEIPANITKIAMGDVIYAITKEIRELFIIKRNELNEES